MPIVLDGNNINTTGLLGSLGPFNLTGSSVDVVGIPVGVKRVTIVFNAISLTGTQNVLIQVGSGSILTSGYLSSDQYINGGVVSAFQGSTSGIVIAGTSAGNLMSGIYTLYPINNTWICSGIHGFDPTTAYGAFTWAKTPSLGGSLDRIRFIQTGSDTFDSGTVIVYYEG